MYRASYGVYMAIIHGLCKILALGVRPLELSPACLGSRVWESRVRGLRFRPKVRRSRILALWASRHRC